MDFELNEMQIIFRNMAKEFAQREIKPVARDFDSKSNPLECIPLDLIKKGFAQDFHKMIIPEQYGGLGLDALTSVIMLEELAVGDPGYALTWHVNNIALTFLFNMASEEQCKEFVTPLLSGEGGIAAISTTEPTGGVTSAQIINPAGFVYSTTAKLENDEWVINGAKCFCSNGGLPFTKWVMTFCRSDMTKTGMASMAVIIVPTDNPGFVLVGEEDKMGHRLSSSASINFVNARVPNKNRLAGGKRTVTYEHDSAVAAISIGIARSAYEAALDFAKQRIVMNTPIIKYELIQQKIADMYIDIEASRALMWRTATYSDTHPMADQKLARAVKVFATEAVNRVVDNALQIFGGTGYSKNTPVEKAYRDARVTTIYEGTNEAQRISLSNLIEAEL